MLLGEEDQEARLGYEGPGKCEGKAIGSGAMDCQGGEARVEDLTPMDQGKSEERTRLRSMNQIWPCEAMK
jgi:hypothetical protein